MSRSLLHDVFLSYSRNDIAIMRRVRDALTNAGLKVWTDEGIEPGTDSWQKAIESAIENTTVLIVLLSPSAKDSIWVGREIGHAQTHQVKIFALMVAGDEKTSIPFGLALTQYVDVRNSFANFHNKLLPVVRRHLGLGSSNSAPVRREPLPKNPFSAPVVSPEPVLPSPEKRPASSTIRLAETSVQTQFEPKIRPLVVWSPISWFRLLLWLLIDPKKYRFYREKYGENQLKSAVLALVNTLAWLPLWIITVGAVLDTISFDSSKTYYLPPVAWCLMITIGWLVSIIIDTHQVQLPSNLVVVACFVMLGVMLDMMGSMIFNPALIGTFGVALSMSPGVALGVKPSVSPGVAFILTLGIALIMAADIVTDILSEPGVMSLILGGIVITLVFFGVFLLAAVEADVIEDGVKNDKSTFRGYVILIALIISYSALIYLCLLGGYQYLA